MINVLCVITYKSYIVKGYASQKDPEVLVGKFQSSFSHLFETRMTLSIRFVPELGQGVALELDDLVDFHKYQTLDSHQLNIFQ